MIRWARPRGSAPAPGYRRGGRAVAMSLGPGGCFAAGPRPGSAAALVLAFDDWLVDARSLITTQPGDGGHPFRCNQQAATGAVRPRRRRRHQHSGGRRRRNGRTPAAERASVHPTSPSTPAAGAAIFLPAGPRRCAAAEKIGTLAIWWRLAGVSLPRRRRGMTAVTCLVTFTAAVGSGDRRGPAAY